MQLNIILVKILNSNKNLVKKKILIDKTINAFKKKTGCPTIVNTSFNVRGEPIVCTPQDAYRCFMRTEMDILVLQNQILLTLEQYRPVQEVIFARLA